MKEKYITYKLGDRTFNVPESQSQQIESKYPDLTIEMKMGDRVFNVPLSEKSSILNKYGSRLNYAFDKDEPENVTSPQPSFAPAEEEMASPVDASMSTASRQDLARTVTDAARAVGAYRKENGIEAKEEEPSTLEKWGDVVSDALNYNNPVYKLMDNKSFSKGLGAGLVGTGRGLANFLMMYGMSDNIGNPLNPVGSAVQGISDAFGGQLSFTTADRIKKMSGQDRMTYDDLFKTDNAYRDFAIAAKDLQERLSNEANQQGNEKGFIDLISEGKFEDAFSKGLATTAESLPTTLASYNPYTMVLNTLSMFGNNYTDDLIDNPDTPAWKRGVFALGSAVLEQAVEKFADPIFKYIGGGKVSGELTEELSRDIIEEFAEEGTETVAKRIGGVLKEIGKSAAGEGAEEVITSFGNDALGEALDAIDGDKTYGIRAQWERYKEENPDAKVGDFAWAKGKEYLESFIGGAISGMNMASTSASIGASMKYSADEANKAAIQSAYDEGETMDYADIYDVDDNIKEVSSIVADAFVGEDGNSMLSEEFINGLSSNDAYVLARAEEATPEQSQALLALAEAKARQEGLTKKLDDRINNELNAQRNLIEAAKENGSLTIGTYRGKMVFVENGRVQSDGTVTLKTGENGPLVMYDTKTGERFAGRSEDIVNVSSINADEYTNKLDELFRQEDAALRQKARETMSPLAKFKAVLPYSGKKILVDVGNGVTEVFVQQITPKGEVLIKGKKGDLGGQTFMTIDAATFYDSIFRDDSGNPVVTEVEKGEAAQEQKVETPMDADYRGQTVPALINGIPTDVYVTSQDNQSDTIVYEFIAANGQKRSRSSRIGAFMQAVQQAQDILNASEQETTPEVSVPESTTESVPNVAVQEPPIESTPDVTNGPASQGEPEQIQLTAEDIDWEALFNQDQETYFAELQKQFGEESADVLNEEIEAVQGELDALSKAKTTNQNERIANRGKKKALQAKLDSLNGMAQRLAATPESELITEPTQEAPVKTVAFSTSVDNEDRLEIPKKPVIKRPRTIKGMSSLDPKNSTELAARELGLKNGGIKLTKESFLHHTGYGASEANALKGLFLSKDKGGKTVEEAGERLMEIDREYNLGLFDQNDPNAGTNAILEALSENRTMGELRSYIARQRQAEAQREADAIYAYEMEQYEKLLDDALRDEVFAEELNAGKAYTEDEYNELMTILAEEINDYDTGNQGEIDILYETEDIGDLPAAEGETYGGIERSNQVLQEAQPVQTSGERDSQRRGANQGIVGEDASSPVHNGESSDNERGSSEEGFVSSLDEDMPDFTQKPERVPVAPKNVADPVEAAKNREKRLLDLVERNGVKDAFKRDKAYEAGKDVGDFFATYEEYEDYQAEATDFGEYNNDFERGVKASFANRPSNELHIGEEDLSVSSEAQELTLDAVMESLDGYVEVEAVSDVKNKDNMELLQTPNGTVYGWTDGKKIYLAKAGFNPNTPIHEYTHLWAKAMMQKNPKGWNSVKQLLKGTPIWDEVINDTNYSNIKNDEDAVASEALSRLSGSQNAAKMEQMAQQMIDEAKGTGQKLKARGLIQNMKDALAKFWNWVGVELFGIENFNSIDEITDRVLWDLVNKTDLQLDTLSESQVEAQIVTDPKVIAELEASPKTKGFRNVVQNEDGTFSSPMAYWLQSTTEGAKSRIETAKFELGKWEEAEEHPELVDESGHITLVKPNKKTVSPVAYDPYIHNRLEPVNLQFKEAWKRNDLVYVETEVADTDLESGYHADKAKLPVGVHSWSNGAVMLSKYDKPVRVMPWDEVADAWAERLNGKGVEFDVVPAEMRSLLVERGVEILPPHKNAGKECNDAYKEWGKEKIALKRNAEPSQSDIPSGDVASDLMGAPTVISPRQSETDAKILNRTQKAKKHLKDFRNGDLKIGEIKSLSDVMQKLHDYLGMGYRGRGMYATYNTPNGTVDFRVNDHNAFGDNFEKGNAEHNLSVYVRYFYFENTSNVPYIEFEYLPEDFEAHPEEIFKDLMSGLDMLLNDGFFPMNLKYATMTPYNIDNIDESILFRRSDIQNAAVDYLVGGPRLRAIENAVNEEAKKLGVTVTYKTRSEMPKGHENDKGYYNTKTGEIVICTENNADINDAIQTILHETVAHKGLRQLMGDRFNEFINRVYNSLDAETKAKVDALADKHYNGNKMVAMEEYMASLAETEDFANTSVWEKIKDIFNNIINSILGRNDIKIGDNELRYILRASYNNMVNPNTMETIEGWAKDTNMRNELGINEATPEILSRTGIDPTDVARESAKQVYDRAVKNIWQEFQRQFQDAYQPVRIAIDAIQQETGNIPIEDYENYILIQNQASSRSRVEIDDFQRKYYAPIIEQINHIIDVIMEQRGWNVKDKKRRAEVYDEVRQYLIAKHGLERNKYYQETKKRPLNKEEKELKKQEAYDRYQYELSRIPSTLSKSEKEAAKEAAKILYEGELENIKTMTTADLRDYSGLTALVGMDPAEWEDAEAEAQKMVDNFERGLGRVDNIIDNGDLVGYEQSIEIIKLWDRINKATDKTLRHSYESGLISRSQYEQIKSMFGCYIPLRGFDETTAEDVYAYARFEGNRFNPAVHKAEGRTSVADDPIAIIMNMAESEIAQGNKNRAKQALYNFLLNRAITDAEGNETQNSLMQVEDVWYIRTFDENGNEVYTIASPNHEAGETYEGFEERMKAIEGNGNSEDSEEGVESVQRPVVAFKSKKGQVDVGMRFQKPQNKNAHYIYLKVNGVDKAIYINGDPKAADAINGTYQQKNGKFGEKFRQINRLISSTFTNYSLEFTARNFFRDMIYSHINIGIKEKDPAYRKKFRKNWRRNNMVSMIKMLNAYRSGEFDTRELTADEAAFVEFMNNGGQTGYTLIHSVESRKKDLQRAIKRMQKGVEKGGVRDSTSFKICLGWIELLNEASELVTRFAAFKTSRDMGRGVVNSINDAKEITVNFNTKGAQDGTGFMGSIARYFGWSKYFFNASVQGVQNTKAMAQANKLKFCSAVGGIAGLGFCMPLITAAIASIFGGDDEEEYWNIPEYDRQNNICISIGKGKYLKIPLPVGFREVYAIGDMVSAMAFDKKFTRDVGQVGTDIANKIASVVLPINPLESSTNGLSIWHTLAYTAAPSSSQFIIQNLSNVDWKGAPLQKEYTYNENDPQWMKAFEGNPDWMKSLSKWCNENIYPYGDYRGMDWSPEKLDNTLSNLFGGIYTVIKKTGNTISMAWNEEERNLSNVPLAGVVLGSGADSDEMYVTDAYFDMKDYYDKNLSFIKRRAEMFGYDLDQVFIDKEGGHHPKMQEIYDNETFDWMAKWYVENKELEKLNKKVKKMKKDIGSGSDERWAEVEELNALTQEFNEARRKFVDELIEMD